MEHTSWDYDAPERQPELSLDDILLEFNQAKEAEEMPGFQELSFSGSSKQEESIYPSYLLTGAAPAKGSAPSASDGAATQADIDAWLGSIPDAPASGRRTDGRDTALPAEEDAEPPAYRRREGREKRSPFSLFGRRAEEPSYEPGEEEDEASDYIPRRTENAPVVHGGSIGKMEQEARSYIAQMQAESGVRSRRERESENAAAYTYDLDDLLSMAPASEAPGTAAAQGFDAFGAPAPDGDPDPFDEDYPASGLEADPTQYADERPLPAFQARREEEAEIDSRFNLTGRRQRETLSYAGNAVDLSADENYVHIQSNEYNPSQWTPDYDDPLADRPEPEEPAHKKHRFTFGRRKAAQLQEEAAAETEADTEEAPDAEEPRRVRISTFTDSDAEPAVYAEDEDELPEYADEDEEFEPRSRKHYKESELYAPPTFREYVLSLLASLWLRIRGTVRGSTAETMEDTQEDLGPEVTPLAASRYYGSFLRSMKLRVRIAGVLLFILCYVSLEAPVPGMLKDLPVEAAFCFGAQAAIMLLALDVVTNGVTNLFRLKPGADSLAVLACLFTGLDALMVALSDTASLHMPLCAISSASVTGLLLAACLNARGLRKATRVPAIGKRFYAVTAEEKLRPGEITLLKSLRSAKGFVRRAEQASPDETLYTRISVPLFVLALVLSLIVAAVKKSFPEFLYIFSAMLVLTVPFGAMLSFSLPFFLGSTRIFRFGAAIAGWSGLCDIGVSKNLIVTDRDLFPPSAVTIESVRIFADEDAQKVISYAGSLMKTYGCSATPSFEDLMAETASPALQVDGFELLPGGGMKGIIDGHVVLCGSTDLMRLMNVRIPFRLTDKTTVLLAIDGILYGSFSLKYEGLPQVRRALVEQMRSTRPPVFAVRDFNINPEMLHTTFDLATDGYDFPPFSDRYPLSEPAEDVKDERITAILCNEGLGPLTNAADVGRTMYLAVRINVLLNLAAVLVGVVLVFIRLVGAGAFPLSSFFLYMLVWTLPVLAVSILVAVKR
ncbi:MAG: hypothetical protein K6F56_02555 [Oscillospiraceae bacterium]|nr:hypothetical protein [Oscillospiraceae bacterium]